MVWIKGGEERAGWFDGAVPAEVRERHWFVDGYRFSYSAPRYTLSWRPALLDWRMLMNKGQTILLPCQLSRSAFSGERVFFVTQADGKEYVGVAPVDYCFRSDKAPIGPDDPPGKNRVDGFVEGRVIEDGGKAV